LTAATAKFTEKRQIPSSVIGMALFVITEVMFFTALISAYQVIKAGYGYWAPPSGITLPVAMTGLNSMVLLGSGVALFLAGKASRAGNNGIALNRMILATAMGLVFVLVQGYEWVNLINFGFTMQASVFAGTFFLLIGAHGLHALGAALFMAYYCHKFSREGVDGDFLSALQVLWFFVVGVWPVLYLMVYF
jgi:heme/copper-type cytochrome/quinol oxidase subunit 3